MIEAEHNPQIPLPSIPWLVQASQYDSDRLGPVWDMVKAQSSKLAALAYAHEAPECATLESPFWVNVAPACPSMCHPNGVPIMCRAYQVTRAPQQASLTA